MPSFEKRMRAFAHAFRGLRVFSTQWHARVHAIAAVIAIALGFVLGLSAAEWCSIVLAITVVCACEAVNTAVELIVDRISLEVHPLSGKAKDVAAGAVLLSAIGAAIVGAIIFGPKLWPLIF
ncbi:MAG TPA: diacylglycerol kinase family protein [Chthoniobacteraceae bacterium]|nr:diacylglycerol kinase family protein [Chthoniobacteraceae bacterium]